MKESQMNHVEINLVSHSQMCKFLKFLYTGKVDTGDEFELLKVADAMVCPSLQHFCSILLYIRLTDMPLTTFDPVVWQFMEMSCSTNQNFPFLFCLHFISTHAPYVTVSKEFLNLEKPFLVHMLQTPGLQLEEMKIFNLVWEWIHFKKQSNISKSLEENPSMSYLPEEDPESPLNYIRFPILSKEDLRIIDTKCWEFIPSLLSETYRYHTIGKIKNGREFVTIPRFISCPNPHLNIDEKGIIYLLGKSEQGWTNPCTLGKTSVKLSTKHNSVKNPHDFLSEEIRIFGTNEEKGSWIEVKFLTGVVKVTAYKLWHGWNNGNYLLSWKFEGFNQTENEWVLLLEHKDDKSLRLKGQGVWAVMEQVTLFSKLRITMTDIDSDNYWYMMVSRFDVYGCWFSNI